MKKIFLLASLCLSISACTSMSAARQPSQETRAQSAVVKPAFVPALKQPRLSEEDILFLTFSTEIAVQRGEWQTGYMTMMDLATRLHDARFARRATEIAFQSRAQPEAQAASHLWLTLAPADQDALQSNISILMIGNNMDALQQLLGDQIKSASNKERGTMILLFQQYLSNINDKGAAFNMLEAMTTPYPALAETHLALSLAAYDNKDVKRAHDEALQALDIQPDSEQALLALTQASPADQAGQLIASFLERNPNAIDVRKAYARLLVEQRQYPAAIKEFQTILQKSPFDRPAMYTLSVLYLQQKQWDAADTQLQQYLASIPAQEENLEERNQVRLLLSQSAEESGNIPKALAWLDQVAPGTSNYISLQIRKSFLQAGQKDIAAARKTLVDAGAYADSEQDSLTLIQAEVQLLRDNGRLADAASTLKLALREYPDNTHLLYDYAMVAEQRKDYTNMEGTLRKIIKLAPEMQHAYNALGYSLAERKIRLPEALKLVEKANQLTPNDPFITDSLGWVYFRMGKLDKAEDALRHAYALRPDPEIAAHLGEVLWARKKTEEALTVWRAARDKDADNQTLKETLNRLKVTP